MRNSYLRILTVLMLALAVTGCDSQRPASTPMTNLIRQKRAITVWDRIGNNAQVGTQISNPRVQYFIKQYSRDEAQNLIRFSQQSTPYIYHVVSMLEEMELPAELALLPIVESEYKPWATSNKGASGIWQIASMTGRLYGLKQDTWIDGRKDIDRATRAALTYLKFLHDKFDNDWLLALAAYNCGDARLSQAIRNNKKLGKPTDYWSLSLPKETMYFVPKFLALSHLIQNSRALGINLAPVANKPYFSKVELTSQIDLNNAATMANLDIREVKRLNPAYRTHVTHPEGPHHILLPVQHVWIFHANLSKAQLTKTKQKPTVAKEKTQVKPKTKSTPKIEPNLAIEIVQINSTASNDKSHKVNTGDTLAIIAYKYKTTVRAIMHKNKLKSDIIRFGQVLSI